jgi:hypothetical protein
MGSVYNPDRIFYNALWASGKEKSLWTASFPDPIVNNPHYQRHRVWIDHILLSPDTVPERGQPPRSDIYYVGDSGKIEYQSKGKPKASDHFPVHCKIKTD